MSNRDQDRRRAKRVESKVRFEAAIGTSAGDGRTTSFETVNLSASGLYFKSDLPVEPMTRFELEIMFPNSTGAVSADAGAGPASVKGEGTVVWAAPDVDDPGNNRFEVGVFFSRIDPAGKERLEAHVAGVERSV
jgi:hypothetical protein